jgi:hypothetical protein
MAVQISKTKFDMRDLKDLYSFLDLIKNLGFEFYHYPEIWEIGIKGSLVYANFSPTTAEYYLKDFDKGIYLNYMKYSEGSILYLGKEYKDYERIELEEKGLKIYYHMPYLRIRYNND